MIVEAFDMAYHRKGAMMEESWIFWPEQLVR